MSTNCIEHSASESMLSGLEHNARALVLPRLGG